MFFLDINFASDSNLTNMLHQRGVVNSWGNVVDGGR